MPRLFLSYAQANASAVHDLAQALKSHGFAVWQDHASLYGGQQWPNAIGEAIAAHDVFLLVWPRHAAASHFVEREWNIAVASQKKVLLCVLEPGLWAHTHKQLADVYRVLENRP